MSQAIAVRPVEHTVSTVGITRAAASKALAPEVVKDLVTQVRSAATAATKVGNEVMWDAALLMVNGVEVSDGILDKGQDTGLYRNQGHYGEALGFSKSYASRLLRIGRAIVRHNVRKGSTQYTFLASHASNSVFAPVLGKDAVTDEAFRAVLDQAMAEYAREGKIGKREAQPDDGSKGGDEAAAANGKTTAESGAPTAGDLLSALTDVEAILHSLSDEGASKVHAAMLRIVSNDRKRRDTLARQAAEVANLPGGEQEEPQDTEQDTPQDTPQA